MSAQRWQRLRVALQEAGLEALIFETVLAEGRRGRAQHGVSRSITLRPAPGWLVEVSDLWWSKSPDAWLGWQVAVSDPQGIVRGQTRALKRHTEVLAAVRLYVEGLAGVAPAPEVAR